MVYVLRQSRLAWLAIGLLVGLMLGGLLPHTPLHAVATDRFDTFAISTGPVDEDGEAVYFLDFLTGDLSAAVLSGQTRSFAALYKANVLTDLGIDPSKNPRFLMVTGIVDWRGTTTRLKPARASVYVAETTSGIVCAYSLNWSKSLITTGKTYTDRLYLIAKCPFRTAAVRPN